MGRYRPEAGDGARHDWECLGLGKRSFEKMATTPKSELLPVLPMDDVVVLPHMSVTLAVEGDDQKAAIEAARQGSRLILLVPRIDGKFGAIGTAARLGESAELPTGAEAFMIRGEYRARLGSGQADIGGALWVKADPILDPEPPTEKAQELAREYRALLENLVESRGVPQVVQFLRAARTPGHLQTGLRAAHSRGSADREHPQPLRSRQYGRANTLVRPDPHGPGLDARLPRERARRVQLRPRRGTADP